jgi:DNA polymerase III subunit epsilon
MNWIARLLGLQRTPLEHERALSAYRAAPAPDLAAAVDAHRLVVVDVETSGLDPRRDRLLAIGAVGVQRGRVPLQDGFEVILRQEHPSDHRNILVHGIDGTTQRSGIEPAVALLRFLEYAGKSPLVAFNAEFDRIAIDRAMQTSLGTRTDNHWLDLAAIAPVVFPEHGRQARTLDEWMRLFEIRNHARHNALADALAAAELLLIVLGRAPRCGMRRLADLVAVSTGRRWLTP